VTAIRKKLAMIAGAPARSSPRSKYWGAAMDRIRLYLVDPNQLFREGLKRLLNDSDCAVVGEARTLGEADASCGVLADILVMDFEEDAAGAGAMRLEEVRARHPQLKIVILTADRSRDTLLRAISWSVDSYHLKDMSAEALICSFRHVMLGQQIFPTKLMLATEFASPFAAPKSEPTRAHDALSPRELQILRCLKSGMSNKAIARELNISEATVKVHLKALLRKVRVSNRTQAAVWALNHSQDEDPLAVAG
jgi:two-component system nitrate/nitrite response regulator NarL